MDIALLNNLHCPFCGGGLTPSKLDATASEIRYGLLTCHCGVYPVVAGIAVFKKDDIVVKEGIAHIKAGRSQESLLALLKPSASLLLPDWVRLFDRIQGGGVIKRLVHKRVQRLWHERATELILKARNYATALDLFNFLFANKENYNYFAFRFGQPRHLVGLSFTRLIREVKRPILCLGSGCGHLTRSLVRQANGESVIGLDDFFFGLYVAKHWIAPGAQYICCRADMSMPFQDGFFSTIFCSDAFQYFVNKVTALREARRITAADGILILVSLRNVFVRRRGDGLPLPPSGYASLVTDMPHRLIADHAVLERYLQKQGPALTWSTPSEELAEEHFLSLVASNRTEVFQDYGDFEDWPHADGILAINPLYVAEESNIDPSIRLRLALPSDHYEEDNSECREYLPDSVVVQAEVLDDLRNRRRTSRLESLIEKCVVIGLPERYQ